MNYPDDHNPAGFDATIGSRPDDKDNIRDAIDTAYEQAFSMVAAVMFSHDRSALHRWKAIDGGFRLIAAAYPYTPSSAMTPQLSSEIQLAWEANAEHNMLAVEQNLKDYALILKEAL